MSNKRYFENQNFVTTHFLYIEQYCVPTLPTNDVTVGFKNERGFIEFVCAFVC